MIYCLNPACPNPPNPDGNVHCQYCGVPIALRNRFNASRVIAQGGFGKTYLARDLDNRNKPCVIKRLTYKGPDAQSNEKARLLFEQEAERLDQLVHPQIPRLLAYFQEGNYLYLVQEVIEGQTLHQEFETNGPFSEAKIKAVLQGLLPVLQFVHSRNVIHRDIKPDNIMRRRNGELILIDFGVAKFLEQSGFSHTTTTIGTPGYAAPEQISGRVTPASDLFALGATCFQLLSGCFDTDEVSTVGYGWVKRWRQHVRSPISDELTAILTKMMRVDDAQRYQDASAVLSALSVGQQSGAKGLHVKPPGQNAAAQPTVAAAPNRPSATSGLPAVGVVASPSVSPVLPRSSVPTAILKPNSSARSNVQPLPNSPDKPIKKVAVDAAFWLRYGLFSYAGHVLGFLAAFLITALFAVSTYSSFDNLTSAQTSSLLDLMYWMHWPIAGFLVGLAQWLVIRRWLARSLWWLPATVAGFWAIAFAIAIGYADAFSGIVVGVFVGLPQWATMRQQSPRAGWWVLWTMVFTALLCRAISTSFLDLLGWLVIVPLLDGFFLSWILRRQHSTAGGT